MVARDLRGARRSTATSACSTSAPARATRPRCWPSSRPRCTRSSASRELAERPRDALAGRAGYDRVQVHVGDGCARAARARAVRRRSPSRPPRRRVPRGAVGAARAGRGRIALPIGSGAGAQELSVRARPRTGPQVARSSVPCALRPARRADARVSAGSHRTRERGAFAAVRTLDWSAGRAAHAQSADRSSVALSLEKLAPSETRGPGAPAHANWIQLVKFGGRRRGGYVDQPRRLHRAARRRPALPAGRDLLVPRRCELELLVEPALDVPGAARPLRLPGHALLRRLGRPCYGANLGVLWLLVDLGLGKVVAQAIAIVAGDAAQLPREQALVVPALSARGAVRSLLARARSWPRRRAGAATPTAPATTSRAARGGAVRADRNRSRTLTEAGRRSSSPRRRSRLG